MPWVTYESIDWIIYHKSYRFKTKPIPDWCCADCSVCSTSYTANLNFRCTPCTGRKWGIAIASIVGGVSLAIGIVVVLYLSSAGMRGSRRSMVNRVARFVPFQSLKIIIVAWQIVTQVSMFNRRRSGMKSRITYMWFCDSFDYKYKTYSITNCWRGDFPVFCLTSAIRS